MIKSFQIPWDNNTKDITITYDPVFSIVIRNVFPKEVNKKILDEAISNKKNFKTGKIGGSANTKVKQTIRNNLSAFYDVVYENNRSDSILLKTIDDFFSNSYFSAILSSSPTPFNEFIETNTHETQVSRYGDKNQKYDWHCDSSSKKRIITVVYYFHKEPKKYKGGEIELSRSPTVFGKIVDGNKDNTITIPPENNMMVIFAGNVSHRVKSTESPKKFDLGRFSVNCWIGKNE
jgi:SM-20-related protein